MTSSASDPAKATSQPWPRLRSLWRRLLPNPPPPPPQPSPARGGGRGGGRGRVGRALADRAPVIVVVAALIAIWYVAAVVMNIGLVRDAFEREEAAYGLSDLLEGSLNAERPLVAAPHQVVGQFIDSVFDYPPDSPRSLVYHSFVTLSATLTGFAIGTAFGIVLAVLIVHVRVLEKSMLPWIICSQICASFPSPSAW